MNKTKNISGWQFAVFRMVFGFYLAWHFAALIPFGAELFSKNGVLPDPALNLTYRAFPNLLAWLDAPWQVEVFLGVMALASLALAMGWQRRLMAVILWYGWACLFNRNNLISNPGLPYVGLLLIFCAIIPRGEPWSWRGSVNEDWRMPALVYWGAWFLMAAGYTYSGVWKLMSPSWQDGSALWHLAMNPLARPGLFRDILLAFPWPVLAGLTWVALAGELLFLLLSSSRKGRLVVWTWMLAMHLGILFIVDFADLTIGMLMIHLFTLDPDWLPARKRYSALLLFDGECGVCDRSVRFLSAIDSEESLRFAALQSEKGKRLVQKFQLNGIDSMALVEGETAYIYSEAVLRSLACVGGFWSLCVVLFIVPRLLRDALYRAFASKRYAWFGSAEVCTLPTARLRRQLI